MNKIPPAFLFFANSSSVMGSVLFRESQQANSNTFANSSSVIHLLVDSFFPALLLSQNVALSGYKQYE